MEAHAALRDERLTDRFMPKSYGFHAELVNKSQAEAAKDCYCRGPTLFTGNQHFGTSGSFRVGKLAMLSNSKARRKESS